MNYSPRPTSGMAVASLVLGIVGVSLLAVIFGHVGLNDTRRHGKDGSGMAVAGLVLGYIGCALYTILIIVAISAAAAAPDFCTTYPASC